MQPAGPFPSRCAHARFDARFPPPRASACCRASRLSGSDWVGWAASAVLIATLVRQVVVQWRQRSVEGVSSWLFVGQLTASVGFTIYSWLVGNAVFVFTNSVLLVTAITGQLIYRRNRRLAEAGEAGPEGQHPPR